MRTFIAIILSVLLGVFCYFSMHNLDSVTEEMKNKTEKIEDLVRDGDISVAEDKLKTLEDDWIENEERLAVYIDHELLEEIGVSIASLKKMVNADDKNLFYAASAELKTKFIHMKDINSLSYRNFI